MSYPRITLRRGEMLMATQIGVMRNINSIYADQKHRRGFVGHAWDNHIIGAQAEYALSVFLGVPWEGHFDTFQKHDVGHYEVKASKEIDGGLIAEDSTIKSDEKLYALVVTNPLECHKTFFIAGWTDGLTIRKTGRILKPRNGDDKSTVYRLSQSDLQDFK